MAATTRVPIIWNAFVILLFLAVWQVSLCGSTEIVPSFKLSADYGFAFPGASRKGAKLTKEPSRMVLESSNEVQALIAFKAGITGDPLGVLHSWRANDSDPCSWVGVECSSKSKHVSTLNLGALKLVGTVSALLGQLSFLRRLDLSNNSLSGSIPLSLSNCSELFYLNISLNQMSGDIPAQVGQLDNLLTLDLSYNNLTGEIPGTLGNCSSLRHLDLGTNSFQGSIPPQFGKLSNLQFLSLESSSLSGFIPPALGNCSSLTRLLLNVNSRLGGQLPLQLGELIRLQQFQVVLCDFQGPFPAWILNVSTLQVLHLSGNRFFGQIPGDIGQHQNLVDLSLASNLFSGGIPSFGNETAIGLLSLAENQLTGTIPSAISLMRNLQFLYLFSNALTGIIPSSLSNCSQLTDLLVGDNPFDPQVLPSWIGSFRNLVSTYFVMMHLHGEIPVEIGQLSQLGELLLWSNNLTGTIPASLGNCTALVNLNLLGNQLTGEIPPELGLLELQNLQIDSNAFPGPFPAFIYNLSTLHYLGLDDNQFNGRLDGGDFGKLGLLEYLGASNNDFEGPIPAGLANCSLLTALGLAGNNLSGEIPPWLANLTLGDLSLGSNQFSGSIPGDLLRASRLTQLDLQRNNLDGPIPVDIGHSISLQYLFLAANNLVGVIPNSLSNCTQLTTLELSHNRLTGSVPAVIAMMSLLVSLDLSHNSLSGPWPSELSTLAEINLILVSNNIMSGSVPLGLGRCTLLETLDLSFNRFNGVMPKDLGLLKNLAVFNASYNNFEGPVPDSGAFKSNITAASFLGNPGLCGGILGPQRQCPAQVASPIRRSHCKGFQCARVWISVVCTVGFVIVLLGASYIAFSFKKDSEQFELLTFTTDPRVRFTKTDILATIAAGEDTVIAKSAKSIVYKADLPGGETIAIKVLQDIGPSTSDQEKHDEKQWEKEILREAHTLAELRHRNIIKVFGLYFTVDMKAIVLQYMPKGSLHESLHENGPCELTWAERFKILLGVTHAMVYLHHEFPDPIIHRDLKPSNILLDGDMEPKVCDFGISNFVVHNNGEVTASTICGTFGYMPPEYATSTRVSTKGDVYSFGVVLLEVLTAKKVIKVDSVSHSSQSENLVSMMEQCFKESPSTAFELLDPTLKNEGINSASIREKMMLTLQVGLLCTRVWSQNRPSMSVVLEMLLQIQEVGQVHVAQRTLDDLLDDGVTSTPQSPDLE